MGCSTSRPERKTQPITYDYNPINPEWHCLGSNEELGRSIEIINVQGSNGKKIFAPEALLFRHSSVARSICQANKSTVLDLNLIFSPGGASGSRWWGNPNMKHCVDEFIIWLFTGQTGVDMKNYTLSWFFGQAIGASAYQDVILRLYCQGLQNKKILIGNNVYPIYTHIKRTTRDLEGHGSELFKFFMDTLAWLGPDDEHWKTAYNHGGELAYMLGVTTIKVNRWKAAGEQAPWSNDGLKRYLVASSVAPSPLADLPPPEAFENLSSPLMEGPPAYTPQHDPAAGQQVDQSNSKR